MIDWLPIGTTRILYDIIDDKDIIKNRFDHTKQQILSSLTNCAYKNKFNEVHIYCEPDIYEEILNELVDFLKMTKYSTIYQYSLHCGKEIKTFKGEI